MTQRSDQPNFNHTYSLQPVGKHRVPGYATSIYLYDHFEIQDYGIFPHV